MIKPVILMLAVGLAASGCNRSINSLSPRSSGPERLPAAPVESVSSSNQLPPPVINRPATSLNNNVPVATPAPSAPTAPTAPQQETQIASVSPQAPSGEPVTRESLAGSWNVASDSPSCLIVLAFTKWTGGYRAATRKCSTSEVSSVSVWDVQGQQVVLMDRGGNTVARLYKSGNERFDGTTNSGRPISFSR